MLCHQDWVMKMQKYATLERFDREQETVEKGHLSIDRSIEALDETCRILNGLELCSRYCAACQIACNIAEAALPTEKKVEAWNPSPVIVRRQ